MCDPCIFFIASTLSHTHTHTRFLLSVFIRFGVCVTLYLSSKFIQTHTMVNCFFILNETIQFIVRYDAIKLFQNSLGESMLFSLSLSSFPLFLTSKFLACIECISMVCWNVVNCKWCKLLVNGFQNRLTNAAQQNTWKQIMRK